MGQSYYVLDSWDLNGGRLRWHGQSSVSLSLPGVRIYIDPFRLYGPWPAADWILITHPHHDHLDPASLDNLVNSSTRVICPEGVDPPEKYQPLISHRLSISEQLTLDTPMETPIGLESVEAHTPDRTFHPRDENWLGYVIETGNKRIYHAGDTGPHENPPRDIDLALVPIDGIYTMDATTAAGWCRDAGFRSASPIHYNTLRGTTGDAVTFCRSLLDEGVNAVRLRSVTM